MRHKEVEVYVDDMIIKSKSPEELVPALRKILQETTKIQHVLKPKKHTFRVISGKFLGYIISLKAIEANLPMIKATTEMPPPRTEKQI